MARTQSVGLVMKPSAPVGRPTRAAFNARRASLNTPAPKPAPRPAAAPRPAPAPKAALPPVSAPPPTAATGNTPWVNGPVGPTPPPRPAAQDSILPNPAHEATRAAVRPPALPRSRGYRLPGVLNRIPGVTKASRAISQSPLSVKPGRVGAGKSPERGPKRRRAKGGFGMRIGRSF